MPSVQEFLKTFPQFAKPNGFSELGDATVLQVSLINITDSVVEFLHLGKQFSVARDDVVDIASTTEPNETSTVLLRIKPNGRVHWTESLSVTELQASIPFIFARPSTSPRVPDMSPATDAWIKRVGYSPHGLDDYTRPRSAIPCESVSGGRYDDSIGDSYD